MAEETVLVQPGSLLANSIGDNNISIKSPRLSSNGRPSTGLFTGKTDEYGRKGKESRAFRKPAKEIGGMVHSKDIGVTSVIKKNVVGNPKPLSGRRIVSPVREKGKQEIVTASEHVNAYTEQSASDITEESDTTLLCDKKVELENGVGDESEKVIAEDTSLATNDMNLFKKSCSLSKGKPSLLKLPSRVSSGSRIIDGRKSVEGNNVSERSHPEIAVKSVGNGNNVENHTEGSKSTGVMKRVEGGMSSPAKKELVKNKSINIKDVDSVNIQNNGKSETPEKQIAAAKRKISSVRPLSSLNPLAVKSLSPLHTSGSHSKKDKEFQVGRKISTSKLNANKLSNVTTLSSSSSSSSPDTKKVSKVVRVLLASSKVDTKDIDDQDIPKDAEVVIKLAPEKKLSASSKLKAASRSALLAPSVTQSTIRPRTSYLSTRVKKSPKETEQKLALKAAELESKNQTPSKVKLRSSTTRAVDTTNKRSYSKKDGHGPSVRIKKTSQGLSNKVIEETANRLIRTRKSKVMALIGAFETVISIQKKSARQNDSKAKNGIPSSEASRQL